MPGGDDNTVVNNGIQQPSNGAQSFNNLPAPVQLSNYDFSPPPPAPSTPPPPSHPHLQRRYTHTGSFPSIVAPLNERETSADLARYNRGKTAPAPSRAPQRGLQHFHSLHATATIEHPHALPQYVDAQAPRQLPSGPLMQESEQETEEDVVRRHGQDSVLGRISGKQDAPKRLGQGATRPFGSNPHPFYAKDLRGAADSLREDVNILHFLDKLNLKQERADKSRRVDVE